MNYEEEYLKLKKEYDTLNTTFTNFKETLESEKTDLENKYNTLKTESETKITELQQANIDLYLKIPQKQPETTPTAQETKTSCDDIIKTLGGE